MNVVSRRDFNALLLASAGSIAVAGSNAASAAESNVIFPYGTHIYREPSLPMEQMLADLPLLKRLGFTLIKLQEVWAYDERVEGDINLEKVARLVSACEQHGLQVYLGLTMENAPAWLWRKFPDATMVYEDGSAHADPTQYVLPSDGKPGPCWYHPGARAAAASFIEKLAVELGRYQSIAYWSVWQEVGFWPNRAGHLGLDYSAYTLQAYRKWLQRKYGTLDQLNATWRTPYAAWEDVSPPRMTPNVPSMVDFRRFMIEVYMPDALTFKRDALRRGDRRQRPVFCHIAPPRAIGGTQEWTWARSMDFFGTSCYPAWEGLDPWDHENSLPDADVIHASRYFELWFRVLMSLDYVRSSRPDGHVWAAELQGGPISQQFKLGRKPDPADIRRWVLGCLASGARGISFWNHRAEFLLGELEGFGLLDAQGERSDRADEAGRIGRAIATHAELFARGERVRPQVAIVVSNDLYALYESVPGMLKPYGYTIRGIYRSLWDEGFGVDFLDLNEIATYGRQYKMLVLPMPFATSTAAMKALQDYARAGGTIVSECGPGRMDQNGLGLQQNAMAMPMRELFGVESLEIRNVREPNETTRWRSSLRFDDTIGYQNMTGEGTGIAPADYLQTLKPVTAKALFTFGADVTGTVNDYGQGRAYLVGTLLGHALLAYGDSRNAKFLAAAATKAGIKPDRCGKLLRLRRRLGSTEAWFLVNPGKEVATESVDLEGSAQVTDLFGGRISGNKGAAPLTIEPLDIACWIVERPRGASNV